ncbi:polysaccharide biosynthesis protein [Microlunatus sp. Y2014]|uniref:polysaccharide biosynthesis protein n=1 Tax=Microlunatus sp. Y2014 TaxID=3418488 RepID=UPI003DA6EBBD
MPLLREAVAPPSGAAPRSTTTFPTNILAARMLAIVWDALSWLVAAGVWILARYEFNLAPTQWRALTLYLAIALTIQIATGIATKLYRGRYRVGSFEEAFSLSMLVGFTTVVAGVIALTAIPDFPRGSAIGIAPVALVMMAVARWCYRTWATTTHHASADAPKALVYGAGDTGAQLLHQLVRLPDPPFNVVGLIDDDPGKRFLTLAGKRVLGTRYDMVSLAGQRDVSVVILANTTADSAFVRDLSAELDDAGIRLIVVPPLSEVIGGRVRLDQLHEVDVEDLLGRHQVETDLSDIVGLVSGRRVLVTGAGGSIGSELARQLHQFGPEKLIMLDRDESALHGVQLSIYGKGLLDTDDMVLCDIRDLDALEKVFAHHRPQVVFHAAALKHLPMLEQYPEEGWKTNVLGTLNVLTCAQHHGVERFVNISTDKAADPSSVLGRTKRYAERLTASYAEQYETPYLSVRFGNVLGSRGSMLHTFRAQIKRGGPVTVTHPDVTRYFMTIPEACQLTLQAAAIGSPGNVLVLDMGKPVSILDVARRLVRESGKQVDIVFTGLRHGEKLHEVLFSENESGSRSAHPLIRQVPVEPIDPDEVERPVERLTATDGSRNGRANAR